MEIKKFSTMDPDEIAEYNEIWEKHGAEGKKRYIVITYDKEKFEAYKTKPRHEWNEDDWFCYGLEVYEKESRRRFIIDMLLAVIALSGGMAAIVMAVAS